MSETRRPVAVVKIRHGQVSHKMEIFKAAQFSELVVAGRAVVDDDGQSKMRIRHNGRWLPGEDFINLEELAGLVKTALKSVVTHEQA